jgi:hypothetical protein
VPRWGLCAGALFASVLGASQAAEPTATDPPSIVAEVVARSDSSECAATLVQGRPKAPALDLQLLPTMDKFPALQTESPTSVASYRPMTALECQKIAYAASVPGQLEDLEADAEAKDWKCLKLHHGPSPREQMHRSSARNAREKSAADALELFYRLAESEAKQELIAPTFRVLDDLFKESDELHRKGVSLDVDAFREKRLDAQAAASSNQESIAILNTKLKALCDLPDGDPKYRIWPTVDWKIAPTTYDVEKTVAEGLANREDLVQLEEFESRLNRRTLSVVQDMLGSAFPPLAMESSSGGLHGMKLVGLLFLSKHTSKQELEIRRAQLHIYHEARRREVAVEIREAIAKLDGCVERLSVERARHDRRRSHYDELISKKQKRLASSLETTTARLSVIDSQKTMIGVAADWYIAGVKLQYAMGRIACESVTMGEETSEESTPADLKPQSSDAKSPPNEKQLEPQKQTAPAAAAIPIAEPSKTTPPESSVIWIPK